MSTHAGFRRIYVDATSMGQEFPCLVWYPSTAVPQTLNLGPYALVVAPGSPVAGESLPLVLISHGSGGAPLTHRLLAKFLAENGYVVAIPQHPGNHRLDNLKENSFDNLLDRPRHLRWAVKTLREHPDFGPVLDSESLFLIGHSVGGTSALLCAGAEPDREGLLHFCEGEEHRALPMCKALEGREEEVLGWKPSVEPKVKALVALDTDLGLFSGKTKAGHFEIPFECWVAGSAKGLLKSAEAFGDRLPTPNAYRCRKVEGAGHFSFLSPFPASILERVGPAGQDPKGFDREAFHQELYAEILSFFISSAPE